MRYLRAALVVALLSAMLLTGAVVVGAQADSSEEVRLVIDLQDDGDARWHVVTRISLTDEDELDSFEDFGRRFEAGEVDSGQGLAAFETAVDESAAASGRDMRLVDTDREWRIVEPDDDAEFVGVGELEQSFTWTNFSRTVDGNIVVDDAFNTTDGTWLPGLAHGQKLVIRPPDGYGSPATAPVRPIEGELHWEGPTTFAPGYFEIVYEPGVDTGPIETDGPDLTTILLVGAIGLSVLALLLGLYLLFRRRRGDDEPSIDGPDDEPTVVADEVSATTPTAEPPEPVSEEDDDLALLADEERIERLLEEHGGRMKQAAIVQETGWSNAKVSQLLSKMDQDDQINKLRIGRENLITLPDEDVGEFSEE